MGLTPHAATFGLQGDKSMLCNFGWYEWVYFHDHDSFSINKLQLGRFLGPINHEGNEMAQTIFTSKGKVVPRCTIQKLTPFEMANLIEENKCNDYDSIITKKNCYSM